MNTEREIPNITHYGPKVELTEDLQKRIDKTIEWYYNNGGADQRTRSLRATPTVNISDIGHLDDEKRKIAVDQVFAIRKTVLGPTSNREGYWNYSKVIKKDDSLRNRLVAYFPDQSIEDGAAEMESRGFFDKNDEPGWDTWVDFVMKPEFNSFLIAWVPPDMINNVEEGIKANIIGAVEWVKLVSPQDLK